MRKLLLVLLVCLASAALAQERPRGSLEPLGGGAGVWSSCRGGGTPGFNLDASTGLYAETCGDYNWHGALDPTQATASYSVTCTGPNTPHTACPAAGYVIDVGYPIHRIAVAVMNTTPGGTVHLTTRPGENYRLYVDVGAGFLQGTSTNAAYPSPRQWWYERLFPTAYALTGPVSQSRTLQTLHGIKVVAEVPCRIDYEPLPDADCPFPDGNQKDLCQRPVYTGVCILNDRGRADTSTSAIDGPATGRPDLDSDGQYVDGPTGDVPQPRWVNKVGFDESLYCDPLSGSDIDCQENQGGSALSVYFDSQHVNIGPTGTITTMDQAASGICIENAIAGTGAPTDTSSGCALAPYLRCFSAVANEIVANGGCCVDTNSSGTCTGADTDLGPCLGNVDLMEYQAETLGIEVVGLFTVPSCLDTVSAAGDCAQAYGQRSYWAAIREFDSAGGCPGSTKSVDLGNDTAKTFTALSPDRVIAGSTGQLMVNWTTRSLADQGQGGFYGVGFSPAHPVGSWSPTYIYTGTTSTTSGGTSTITIAETPNTIGVDTVRGYTVVVNPGDAGFCIRTISASTATTLTWTGGNCVMNAGDDFAITPHACMSSAFGGTPGGAAGTAPQDEVACDSEALFMLAAGESHGGGVFDSHIVCNPMDKSCIDQGGTSHGWVFSRNFVDHRRGLAIDAAGMNGEYSYNNITGAKRISHQQIFAALGVGYHVHTNRFMDFSGDIFTSGYYSADFEFDHNLFSNLGSGSALIGLTGGKGFYFHDNTWVGVTPSTNGGIYLLQPGNAPIQNIVIEREEIDNYNSSGSAINLIDSTFRMSQIAIRDIDIYKRGAAAYCGVVVDAVNIGADAQTITVEGVDVEGTGSAGSLPVCIGNSGAIVPSTRTAIGNVQYYPHTKRNSAAGALVPDVDRVCRTAAQWGDANTGVTALPPGLYCIADDDGTCTDTSSDGTLDGGDTIDGQPDPPANCKWSGTAWAAP